LPPPPPLVLRYFFPPPPLKLSPSGSLLQVIKPGHYPLFSRFFLLLGPFTPPRPLFLCTQPRYTFTVVVGLFSVDPLWFHPAGPYLFFPGCCDPTFFEVGISAPGFPRSSLFPVFRCLSCVSLRFSLSPQWSFLLIFFFLMPKPYIFFLWTPLHSSFFPPFCT